MSLPKRDSQYHTYGDYLIWSRTHGDELIDGTAYVKEPPSPSEGHQLVAGEIFGQLRNALEDTEWLPFMAPLDVRLPKSTERDEDVDTIVQPDVLIVGPHRKRDARGIRGAPDWLAEVLSPWTARYDRKIKIPIYERAGVPEVWLIDLRSLTVEIYRLSEGRYGPPTINGLQGRTQLTAVPGATLDWDRLIRLVRRFAPELLGS